LKRPYSKADEICVFWSFIVQNVQEICFFSKFVNGYWLLVTVYWTSTYYHLQKNKTGLACWPEVLAAQQLTTCGAPLSATSVAIVIIPNSDGMFNENRKN
jgi:hypothetical protein